VPAPPLPTLRTALPVNEGGGRRRRRGRARPAWSRLRPPYQARGVGHLGTKLAGSQQAIRGAMSQGTASETSWLRTAASRAMSNAKQLKHLPRRSVGTGRRGRYAWRLRSWRFQRLSTFIQPSASGARATILRPRPSTMRTMRGAIGGGEPPAPAIGAVSRNLHNSAGLTQLPQVSWHGHAQAAIFPQLLASFPPCCPIRCRTRAEALRRAEGHSSFSAHAHNGAAPPKTVISTSCGSSCSSSP